MEIIRQSKNTIAQNDRNITPVDAQYRAGAGIYKLNSIILLLLIIEVSSEAQYSSMLPGSSLNEIEKQKKNIKSNVNL